METSLIHIKCNKVIGRKLLNMSITGDFLDTTKKVLLSGKEFLYFLYLPSPLQPAWLCYMKLNILKSEKEIKKNFTVRAK